MLLTVARQVRPYEVTCVEKSSTLPGPSKLPVTKSPLNTPACNVIGQPATLDAQVDISHMAESPCIAAMHPVVPSMLEYNCERNAGFEIACDQQASKPLWSIRSAVCACPHTATNSSMAQILLPEQSK